jgi:protein-S-isoprenylcysteine O-methyltransferase Ste14
MTRARGFLGTTIVLYFIIALKVLIMISPFAAFFYAAFNPFLLFLAQSSVTRWLASFFLPHMVLPPGDFLKAVRVAGSVLFVGGAVLFVLCAGHVYTYKVFRLGPALGGFYKWIRHPQYLALAATGLGLAILWPRFLTIVLWVMMVALYYFLAKDEERRMVKQFGDQYSRYMTRTGMFFPRAFESIFDRIPFPRFKALRPALGFVLLAVVTIGSAFALRAYTIARLPLWSEGRVTALAILPGDTMMLDHRMADILELPEVQSRLGRVSGPVLVYVMPPQYVMQGMIADTGPQWRLYQHHQTLPMIMDWVFHLFRHLERGHMMMHHAGGGGAAAVTSPGAVVRRFIFLRIDSPQSSGNARRLFGINAHRVPLFYADVDVHHATVLDVTPLGPGTGWGRVPTPMF